MAGMGTGAPCYFACPKFRSEVREHRNPNDHICKPTGKTKKYRRNYKRTDHIRHVMVFMEYHCTCGYVGWTRHIDMAARYRYRFKRDPKV